jgi:hypothetical protein
VTAETGGGGIDVGSVEGNVTLETGGGNIKIASAKGEIKAESGGAEASLFSPDCKAPCWRRAGAAFESNKCSGTVKASRPAVEASISVRSEGQPRSRPALAAFGSLPQRDESRPRPAAAASN